MTLKGREPKAAEGKKLTLDVGKAATVSRNDSFKKQLGKKDHNNFLGK